MTIATLILFATLLAGATFLVLRSRKTQSNTTEPSADDTASYHCVEIRCENPACTAVKALPEARFLPHEAPRLPLPHCTQPVCSCRYAHHEDRREDFRRNPYGQGVCMPPKEVGGERRAGSDRRADT